MASGHTGADLSRWRHGDSSEVECQDGCGYIASHLSDAKARRLARQHAAHFGHVVEISRTLFQNVYPPSGQVEPDSLADRLVHPHA